MSFLYPAFLIGAGLIAIPIVLHLLRRDVAPEVPFTAVRLLRRSPLERSRRRRLRDLLLLLARAAALLLLAAAFARPYFAAGAASGGVRIVAVDRSFSMGAPGQFARALALARSAIDAAGGSDRVAVIAFDERAHVIAPPGSAADARAALGSMQPGFGATRYGPVLVKAAELIGEGGGSLVVITDLQRAGWEDQARGLLPSDVELQIADAGAPPANLALTSIRHEKDRLVASIRNTGPEVRAGDVRATRDGRVVGSATFTAAADAFVDVPIAVQPGAGGALTIGIDDPSGFEADNARYATLDAVPRPAALIVTSGTGASAGFYLARALEAAAGAEEGTGLAPKIVTGAQVSAMADSLSQYRAVVLLSTRGLDRRVRAPIGAFVRTGGGLFVAASTDVEPSVLSNIFDWDPALPAVEREMPAASLSATDLRHPIFRPFGGLAANLGHARFERSWRVTPDGWDVAARFTDGTPALLDRREGAGRVVLFASDVDRRWNDFPLHSAFVPFAVETLRYVAAAREDAREFVISRVPEGVPAAPGVHPYHGSPVAVNVDPRESATARLSEGEFRDMVEQGKTAGGGAAVRAQQIEARQSYWRFALLLMLGVLVVESVVGKP